MAQLTDYHKREVKPKDEVERVQIFCTMYTPASYDEFTDTFLDKSAPKGCKLSGYVSIDDTGGWFWVERWAFCPNCAVLWKKRYGDTTDIIKLMEG